MRKSTLKNKMKITQRPLTLFTGQWADLPLATMIQKAKAFGYDGLELACWGDHLEVQKANQDYCDAKVVQLKQGGMELHAISAHLVGQGVCDRIDERHKSILPAHIWGDGDPEGVRRRCQSELIETIRVAGRLGVKVVNGFTGSSIWHLLYSFPPASKEMIHAGFDDFAKRFGPILDMCEHLDVNFALEVHPTEIAFDIASFRTALKAVGNHKRFGANYDPSHLGYQRVDYVRFIREFADRIFHVHMKDVAWEDNADAGVFGGHTEFHKHGRAWDFRSLGRGDIDFERIIRALNDIGYTGPLSVEWEDGGMDREHGAAEAAAFVRDLMFPTSDIVFDGQFDTNKK